METGLFPEECLTPAGIRGQNQVNAQNETHTSSHRVLLFICRRDGKRAAANAVWLQMRPNAAAHAHTRTRCDLSLS